MKLGLQTQLSHQLKMTPQLQQAIKLLQLSTLDLQQEIQAALDSNPMLELIENQSEPTAEETPETRAEAGSENEPESLQQVQLDGDHTIPEELPIDVAWEDLYQPSFTSTQARSEATNDDFKFDSVDTGSLFEQLLWQLDMSSLTERDKTIGFTIIESLNEDGYLLSTLEDLTLASALELEVNVATGEQDDNSRNQELHQNEVATVLSFIQSFDPPGVGARDLKECLQLQLTSIDPSTQFIDAAIQIVNDHMDLLGSRDYAKLVRHSRLSDDKIKGAIRLIQTLDPKPGQRFTPNTAEYITPDVYLSRDGKQWKVELNQDCKPNIQVSKLYTDMMKNGCSGKDKTYLKDCYQEAKWFIKSLNSRNETLLKVAGKIVEFQRAYFEQGPEAMLPLVLYDVAEAIEMHESTVSRVTNQKYMHTPQGVFELKYFFSSHVSTSTGGERSSTAIRALIKKLVDAENTAKPLSDNKITKLLDEQGINVARRTVAKYRESMKIPPSNERKKLF